MHEHETPQTYGYACVLTNPNRKRASSFATIMSDIFSQRRIHLNPYYPDSTEIYRIDLTQDEQSVLIAEAKTEIGNPDGLLWLSLDKLRFDGCLNLGLFAADLNAAMKISRNNRGIRAVQFCVPVYQDSENQFMPFEHPLGDRSSIVRLK